MLKSRLQTIAASATGLSSSDHRNVEALEPPVDNGTGSVFEMPNLSSGSAYASTARQAGRLNAMSVSKEEYEALLTERQQLLDKHFDGSISKREQNRLAYVRWSLDRIEDAQHGASMDLLENQVENFEHLIREIARFNAQLEHYPKRKH